MHLDEDLAELQRKFGPIPGVTGGDQVDNDDTDDMTVDMGGANAGQFNDLLLQAAVPVDAGDPQQVGEEVHQGADQLADLRVLPVHKPACKTCCCPAHHLYSLHYSGSKFVALPADSMEWEYPNLAEELDRDTSMECTGETKGGLEDLIMSVNMNLDTLS